jgi:hypothetical protein
MFMNCNTLCRVDLLKSFDGTFSEGGALNGVAFTGASEQHQASLVLGLICVTSVSVLHCISTVDR